MRSFKDTAGRTWDIAGNMLAWARVKSASGVDLTDIATEERKSIERLTDPYTLVEVLWAVVEPQATQRGMTADDFFAGLNGETLAAAHIALLEEMVFFCRPRVRAILELMLDRMKKAEAAAEKELARQMPAVEREIDAAISSLTFGSTPGSSPESSASTPGSGPFASSTLPSAAGSGNAGITPARSSRRSRKFTVTRSSAAGRTRPMKSTR
jgi:hypothetical protein